MKIDQLPVELLIKIFGYLPVYGKVSLVSHRFYDVACEVSEKNITLSLDAVNSLWQEDLSLLQSIQNTKRKILKVEIRGLNISDNEAEENEGNQEEFKENEVETVISVIAKFSTTIKHLRLQNLTMDDVNFLRILSLVPNAEQMFFEHLSEYHTVKRQRLMSSTKDLNLKRLKTLEICNCDEMFVVTFNRLPAGVLTELQLARKNLLLSRDLFRRQRNIKKLDLLNCKVVNTKFFYNMKLESLKCLRWCGPNIVTALRRQAKLKSLTLGRQISDEHLMKFIAPQLTQLEKLELLIDIWPVQDIVNIGQFRKLKHLTLNIGHGPLDIFDAFSELTNLRITTLEIMPLRNISINQIQKLATSVPLLKVLKVYNVRMWEQIIAILKHFNFVNGLHFECYDEGEPFDEQIHNEIDLNQSDSVNPKLTELSINFANVRIFDARFIQKLISDYPNLKNLDMASDLPPLTSVTFQLIIDGFTKLESLKLYRIEGLTIDDFKYLRHDKKNLKFVSLQFWKDDNLLKQHTEELEAMFEVVKIRFGRFSTAVDAITLNREMNYLYGNT